MLRSRLINFSLVFVMAAYLPLWICCATHAAPASEQATPHAAAQRSAAGGCCPTTTPSHTQAPDPSDHPQPHQDCTCTERASAAFVHKTVSISFEPVQPLFDLLPGNLGRIIDSNITPACTPRVLTDASPPGGGPLLDQFCLLTT